MHAHTSICICIAHTHTRARAHTTHTYTLSVCSACAAAPRNCLMRQVMTNIECWRCSGSNRFLLLLFFLDLISEGLYYCMLLTQFLFVLPEGEKIDEKKMTFKTWDTKVSHKHTITHACTHTTHMHMCVCGIMHGLHFLFSLFRWLTLTSPSRFIARTGARTMALRVATQVRVQVTRMSFIRRANILQLTNTT